MSYQRQSYRSGGYHNQPYRSDVVDVETHLHWVTEKAVRVSLDGVDANAVWIPKVFCQWEPKSHSPDKGVYGRRDEDGTLTLPERVAKEKGLV